MEKIENKIGRMEIKIDLILDMVREVTQPKYYYASDKTQPLNEQPEGEINPYEKITKEYADAVAKDEEKVKDKIAMETYKQATQDTPEEWVCSECGFDDCYPFRNSEDFELMYCPMCDKLVNLN